MILQRLAEHYDRIAAEGVVTLAPPGFSMQKMSFCIVLNPDGTLNQFESLLQQEGKRLVAKSVIVPGQSKPTGQGLNPCLLWDNAEYLLGYTEDPQRKARALAGFTASRDMHLALEDRIGHPAFSAVCAFFRAWSPALAAGHDELQDMVSNFGLFRIAGSRKYVHEEIDVPRPNCEPEQGQAAMCLVSGVNGPAARLHEPKIKGVRDAQSSGALLVSFNATAFTSYGKEQSFNAPVSSAVVFKYANALNYLLSPSARRSMRLGDATVVYWADHFTVVAEAFGFLFTGPQQEEPEVREDRERAEHAKLLLTQLRDGMQTLKLSDEERETRFFILGLSPNASRLSVRLWVEANASVMLKRLQEHVSDFALCGGFGDLPAPIWRVALATGRAELDPKGRLKSYDPDSVAPSLTGELARSVLTGAPYPQSLLAAMVRRVLSDRFIGYERVSAIKACLIRNTRYTANPLEVPLELDAASQDVAYRCGRLFAVLEKAQSDSAGGELNSTIKDRYFSAATVTPAVVFPRLFRLNGHHLNKLSTGSKIFYEQLMGPIMAAPFEFPRQLSLQEQGKFIVGYFQQRQDLYTSKKNKDTEENA